MFVQNGLSEISETLPAHFDEAEDRSVTDPALEIQVSVYSRLNEAAPEWQQLMDAGLTNPYQSAQWLSAWQATLGKAKGIEAAIGIGRSRGRPVVILPMGVETAGGIRTLSFLGHQNGNQNTGIWDKDFYALATQEQIRFFLNALCRETKADLLALQNVPETWHGRPHPLVLEKATKSPSPIFVRALPDDFEVLFRDTHSKSSRKNLLRKQRHLQAAGGYRVVKATTQDDIGRGLEAFLSQRARRAAEAGIPNAFSGSTARHFLERLLGWTPEDGGDATRVLSIWYLEVDGIIRSTYLCSEWDGTIHAYSNSVAHDDLLPNSPGLVLIKEIIDRACASEALDTLDLGLGEERYKTTWADSVPLKDSFVSVTLKGTLKEQLARAVSRTKTAIRSSGWIWPLVRRLRKWKAG